MPMDITNFPPLLANALGIDLFTAQILASILMLSFILMPILFITKGRNFFAVMTVGLLGLGFCIAIEWLPFWFLIIIVMLTALLFADKFKRAMG